MTTYVQNFLKFQPLLKELIARDIKVKIENQYWVFMDIAESVIYDDRSVGSIFESFFKFE